MNRRMSSGQFACKDECSGHIDTGTEVAGKDVHAEGDFPPRHALGDNRENGEGGGEKRITKMEEMRAPRCPL